MNRKDFLKRIGLLTTTAEMSPEILAEQSQLATTNEPVERMRIGSNPDGSHFIMWPNTDKELRR
jgi:hypothetical protein